MKSYASLERFENNFAVLELELETIEESKKKKASEKRTRMVNVPITIFPDSNEVFSEGDIVIIEHECGFIMSVLGRDDDEREKRVERLRKIKETFRKKE